MKQLKNIIILIFLPLMSMAQQSVFQDYNWSEKPTVDVPERYKNEEEVILDRTYKVEIAVSGNQSAQYFLFSDKIYVNSDDSVERNNKVYIPFGAEDKVIANKLRVILKNGKVINVNESDIKEEIDEERGVKYQYYAVNGLEKGAIIERFYIIQEAPDLDGKTFRLQGTFPVVKASFEIIYPKHLLFQVKSYNGLPTAVADDSKYPDKKSLLITDSDIAGIKDDEKYSNRAVHLKMVRYKLSANKASGARNMYNFNDFAGRTYDRFHPELDKKQQKAVEDFAKSIPKSKDSAEQIWHIENKIKKTISYDRYFEQSHDVAQVLKSKQAGQSDLLLLYTCILSHFQIEHEIVLTNDRFKLPFDPEFQSYENIAEVLLYLPDVKQYLSPTEYEYRTPLFPDNLGNTNGLHIREKLYAGVKMGIADVRFIPLPDMSVTHDFMDITVDFSRDIENPTITSHFTYGGYSALNFQPMKDFLPADEYTKILKQIAENYTQQPESKSIKAQNDGLDFVGRKPFLLDIIIDGNHLVQKAGSNYLFQIGKIIGRQMELYQEHKRMLPVEIDHPHAYTRKITVILPPDTNVKNTDKLAMHYKTDINGKTEAEFLSKYTQEGNRLVIDNTEYYNLVNYPLENFDAYRAVINAAADFNKAVIVLSP